MPGEAITLGPFTGGVVTRVSDPSALQNEDLVQGENFIFDIYGSLITRPPLGIPDSQPNNPNNYEIDVVLSGFFSTGTGTEVTPFIIVTMRGSTQVRVGNGPWQQIASGRYEVAVQGSKGSEQVVWFAKGFSVGAEDNNNPADLNGGWWEPSRASIQTLSAIPSAEALVLYKERLFFLNTGTEEKASRVLYSEIAPVDNSSFPSGNTLDVNINDGQSIRDGVVFLDNIFVFKYSSTYIITYDTGIDRVQVRPVSDTVGVGQKHCYQLYADQLYVFDNRFIWRFTGSQFVPLSQKIIASAEPDSDPTLSQWADCLLLRLGDTAWVFNFYTDSWTTWKSERMFNYLVQYSQEENFTTFTYFGGTRSGGNLISLQTSWPRVDDPGVGLSNENSEPFEATMETKHFDFGEPYKYKRLFWWGLNALVNHTTSGQTLKAGFLQVDENSPPATMTDLETPDTESTGTHTQVYKFLRSYRFRLAAFYIKLQANGATPQSINSLTAVVRMSQVARGTTQSLSVGVGVRSV